MASRKDNKGRVLKQGESYRKNDGLYMYRLRDEHGGKYNTIYAHSLEELRDKEDEIQRDMSDGIRSDAKHVTVNDIYEMWINDKVGLKQTTKSNYTYMYEHFVKEGLGEKRVQTLKKSDVRRFYNKLIDTDGIKMNTLDNIHTVLHQVLKVAVEDEYIRTNPSEGCMGDCKRAHGFEAPKQHSLTFPEQEEFLRYMKETPRFRHWYPLFAFLLGTGMRISEAVGIRWDDIHLEEDAPYIEVNHNTVYYSREEGKCYFSISTPKTEAGVRIIPVMSSVKEALLEEKEYQKEVDLHCEAVIDGYTNFVFLNRYGNIHNPQTVNRAIKRISRLHNEEEFEKAEKEHREPLLLPPFSCHNLRHTFASRLCESETNLKAIQEIMGHRDIATTMDVYAEATKDIKVNSIKNLEDNLDRMRNMNEGENRKEA